MDTFVKFGFLLRHPDLEVAAALIESILDVRLYRLQSPMVGPYFVAPDPAPVMEALRNGNGRRIAAMERVLVRSDVAAMLLMAHEDLVTGTWFLEVHGEPKAVMRLVARLTSAGLTVDPDLASG